MRSEDFEIQLSNIPEAPGCYLYFDKNDQVIYVGKAKVLKRRVRSYFTGAKDAKTTQLISEIIRFEYIVTTNELESLILEYNLIKEHNPKYNIMLKRGDGYPYIAITKDEHPKLDVVYNPKKGKYRMLFGPYPTGYAAHEIKKMLDILFPLRQCKTLPKKVCLYYHLGQCAGPCVYPLEADFYTPILQQIKEFLKGNTDHVVKELTEKMMQASENLAFEKAAEYRNVIQKVHRLKEEQHINIQDNISRDFINYYIDRGYLSVVRLKHREGKLIGRDMSIVPLYDDVVNELSKVCVSFFEEAREQSDMPKEIIVPEVLYDYELRELYTESTFVVPQRGTKRKLLLLAFENARTYLEERFKHVEKLYHKDTLALRELEQLLDEPDLYRIEVFDNSNISGDYAVSGMVVYIDGIKAPKEYRKFKVKHTNTKDDYAMMREVLTRRYTRVVKENKELPNLIIVDGGIGHVHVARDVMERLELPIPIIGLVKNEKHQTESIITDYEERILLDKKSHVYHFLYAIQEEVHRFALSYHKTLHKNTALKSVLDDIPGVGKTRKKLLRTYYPSIDRLKQATSEDLMTIGFPKHIAEGVVAHFQNKT